jgi:hypothetical protein
MLLTAKPFPTPNEPKRPLLSNRKGLYGPDSGNPNFIRARVE